MKITFILLCFLLCLADAAFGQSFTILQDIIAGSGSSNPAELTNVNGTLFFVATNAANGRELWKSDGTVSGTVLVKDIRPGTVGSEPMELTNVNGILFFSADDGVYGRELWKSDGTAGGTVLVRDANPGCCYGNGDNFSNRLTELTASNGKLFFQAINHTQDVNGFERGTELWISDGTAGGTDYLKDIYPGLTGGAPNNGNPINLTDVNGTLYFAARNADGVELWKSDGTEAGTVQVKDINPGAGDSNPANLTNVNGTLYFSADDGTNGNELWKSDGTAGGTVLIDIYTGSNSSNPLLLTNVNGTLFFEAENEVNNRELWKSNGTLATTVRVKDIFPGTGSGHPTYLTNVNGTLFFQAYDGNANGTELWKSDGTEAGTTIVKDIYPGSDGRPADLTAYGTLLIFTGIDAAHGREIWKSDGTAAGTVLLQDIEAGAGSSAPEPTTLDPRPMNITDVNGKLFITPTTTANGKELWVYNPFITLPVTSLDLKGYLVQNNGLLEWKTLNESNTFVFIIERSTDGLNFNVAGTIASAGNTNGLHNYQFKDANITALGASVIYYRINQKDIDGRVTYSRVITLLVNSKTTLVNLYPNPVKNEASLMISTGKEEQLQWQVADNTGRILKQNMLHLPAGSTSIGIDVKGLAKGVYYLRVQTASFQQHIKFFKD